MERLTAWLDGVTEFIGRAIAWLTLAMVLLTLAVVILRYVFQTGSIALQESVTYLHAVVFMLGAAYTLKHDGHVRVDIFYQQRSPHTRAWIDLLGTVLLLMPVCAFILVSSLDYVGSAWAIREGSRQAGGLDGVYLLKTVIPAMAILLLMQGVAMALRSVLVITGHRLPAAEDSGLDREL